MSALASLTEAQKNEAFLKAKLEVSLEEGQFVRITEVCYERALEFIRKYFLTEEPLHKAAAANWGRETIDMHMEAIGQDISIMIVNADESEIIAMLTVQVMNKGEVHGEGELEDEGLRTVWKYVNTCEKKANLYEHFGVQEAVTLVSLVTNPKYRNRGFGANVVKASLAMIRNLGVGRICVKGEGSSLFTQKIFEREGMLCLYTGVYAEHKVNGEQVFGDTGIHRCFKCYGMMVESK